MKNHPLVQQAVKEMEQRGVKAVVSDQRSTSRKGDGAETGTAAKRK